MKETGKAQGEDEGNRESIREDEGNKESTRGG